MDKMVLGKNACIHVSWNYEASSVICDSGVVAAQIRFDSTCIRFGPSFLKFVSTMALNKFWKTVVCLRHHPLSSWTAALKSFCVDETQIPGIALIF